MGRIAITENPTGSKVLETVCTKREEKGINCHCSQNASDPLLHVANTNALYGIPNYLNHLDFKVPYSFKKDVLTPRASYCLFSEVPRRSLAKWFKVI
jgi:hypothetical protein